MKKTTHRIGEHGIFVEHAIPEEKKVSTPLVFIHGSFGGYFMWNMFVEYFLGQGYECVALSLRGHKPSDESDLGTLKMQDYVDDVCSAVEGLDLDNFVVIGHSMGGLIALMYGAQYGANRVVVIDSSTTQEVTGSKSEEEVADIPNVYNARDAGMPQNPQEVMAALPDISPEMLMKMKEMLGDESGSARRDRKIGISIPKEKLTMPLLMLGAELADSVPFGIPIEVTQKMAKYYDAEFVEIKGATHPGIIMGKHSTEAARAIEQWLR